MFLNLSLVKDEYDNSIQLIELIKEDLLFSEIVKEKDNYADIKRFTEDYLFSSDSFDKNELADKLRTENKIDELSLNEIYSDDTKKIDADFKVSKRALKEKYEKKIEVSPDTYIYTENYRKLKKMQAIKYKDGDLILSVDENFIDNLPEELKSDD